MNPQLISPNSLYRPDATFAQFDPGVDLSQFNNGYRPEFHLRGHDFRDHVVNTD